MITKVLLRVLLRLTRNQKPLLIDDDYMQRWFIIPRNPVFNIYFHRFFGSDAPTMHDHPWVSFGLILSGEYVEHTPKGDFVRREGDWTLRMPSSLHWIEIDKPVYTLFITGPRVRLWGFLCKDKWINHIDYIKNRGGDRLASGCGESVE